jgi:hypothetical protein
MTKQFCDICGDPAQDKISGASHAVKHGKPYRSFSVGGSEALFQCRIVVRATFGFEGHETGFGGPPDLCSRCALKLLNDLARQFEIGAGKQEHIG